MAYNLTMKFWRNKLRKFALTLFPQAVAINPHDSVSPGIDARLSYGKA